MPNKSQEPQMNTNEHELPLNANACDQNPILPPIEISSEVASQYSFVFQQNQFPLIKNLKLTNDSQESFKQIQIIAEFDPPEFEPATWDVDELSPGQSISLNETYLRLSAGWLERLNERRMIGLKFSAVVGGREVAAIKKEVELLPKKQWGGEMHMPELLAAFVTPNTVYCDTLLKKASNLLAKDGYESKLDGYQSNTRERPYMVCAALWSVISGEGISYSVPPASFARSGQKIRLGLDISHSRLATCLDTALLFASCLEQAGLNGVIALTKGHAMAGAWLIDENFPLVTNDDPLDLRNRIALNDLILFETTLATNDQPIQFAQAIREANQKLSEQFEDEFVYVIDLKQARSRKIFPIDFDGDDSAAPTEGTKKHEITLPLPPELPPVVDQQDKPLEELTPDGRVDQWMRKLLDLSKRNKLLNIRQRSMGFKIICPDLDFLEDELAAGERFNLLSKDEMVSDGRDSVQFTKQTGNNLETEFARDQLRRGTLIADCSNRDLEKNLINLFRRAKSDMEEGGSNTLFLAIGMLRWKSDPRSDQSYRAPLILLPVKLERTSARAKPKVKQLPDEGPVFNLTLIELLLQDFEIDLTEFQHDLPEDESGVDVRGIWNTVRSRIKETPGFEVVEELVLSNFSFAKYLMWKDLRDRLDDLKESRFVNHLLETPTDPYPFIADFIDLREVDEKINPLEFFAPLNADSSQIVAIEASTKGKDFVLEGPPGTGKSETIANIIAHNMALGQKVLFVSEKMAALEVVYSRLKKVGLGHLCLELHSNRASKKGVVDQLKEAWEVRESYNAGDWEEKAQSLGKLRNGLNRYVEELHRKSHFGYSVHETIARSVRRKETARIKIGWADMETAPLQSERDVQNAKRIARDLGLAFRDVKDMNPKSFALVSHPEWSNRWQANLIDAAHNLLSALSDFRKQLEVFCSVLSADFRDQPTMETVECWLIVARACGKSEQFSHRYILEENAKMRLEALKEIAAFRGRFDALLSDSEVSVSPEEIGNFPISAWKERARQSGLPKEVFAACGSVLAEMKQAGFCTYIDSVQQQEIDQLMDTCDCSLPIEKVVNLPVSDWVARRDVAKEKGAISRFFVKWKIMKEMRVSGLKKNNDLGILDCYAQLIDKIVLGQKELFEQLIQQAAKLAGLVIKLENQSAEFKGEGVFDLWESTLEHLQERWDYGVATRRSFMEASNQLNEPGVFMAAARKKLIDEREFLEGSELIKYAVKLTELYIKVEETCITFKTLAGESDLDGIPIQTVEKYLEEIDRSAPALNAWCHWVEARNRAEEVGLSSLVRGMESRIISWDEVEEQFETALCSWLTPLSIDSSDILRNFSAGKHDALIQHFREIDEHLAKTTGQYVAARLAADMPKTSGANAPHEYGVLSREVQRQRGHKPVRQLIQELGDCLLDLTPCFMMSPLSVAQYIPSDYQAFDLVVFDEASQITVWDAVGAIARGKNVIVVGDPKQMPPTNFFSRVQDDGDSDEADLESILDQAMAARVGYHRLTGHYRSRHESLITFSNHQYYQNSLTTYPSADTRETAVIWHRVNGVYSKGASRNNPIEARAVVDEVVRRLKDPQLSKLSIGIVTFNSEQQQLIENLLDDERRKNTSLEQFFEEGSFEPIFVKNLETVQGDQRDVICLSVGYGPVEPGALTMSMNFGPLNRQGGERRLNVAITRASTEMLVFTSFDAAMIDLSRTSAQAVKDLKAYIDYAARGSIALAQRAEAVSGKDQFDSEFEEAVAIRLRERGWDIRTQIGVSKFRIDLGVLDPDSGGAFLAGVECDGASYHSSPSARDRDRVRHIILENLGWSLIRIWSTDYFINPDNVIDRVHHELETILEQKRASRQQMQEKVVSHGEVFDPPEIEEYEVFSGRPMADPRETNAETIAAGLLEIIQVEGPMLAKRAYDTYLHCCGINRMGKDIRRLLNRALQSMVNCNAVIKEDEWNTGDSLYSIIRLPEQNAVRLRTCGGRIIDEIPPSEIRIASELIISNAPELFAHSEEHFRKILEFYELKRLTEQTREKLLQALPDKK